MALISPPGRADSSRPRTTMRMWRARSLLSSQHSTCLPRKAPCDRRRGVGAHAHALRAFFCSSISPRSSPTWIGSASPLPLPPCSADLGLSQIQFAWVFTVFYIAYGICEIPTAWLGDRLGQRRMLIRIVGCWSVFTVFTGWPAACRAC